MLVVETIKKQTEHFVCENNIVNSTPFQHIYRGNATGFTGVNKRKNGSIGIRRQKSGRHAAVITDPIRHKEVWLGTFGTVEEASQAYLSKKSEFEKLLKLNQGEEPIVCVESSEEASCLMANVHGTKHCDQIQPVGASMSVDNDQTLNVASVGSKKAIDSQGTKHFFWVRKRKSGRYACEIHDPVSKKMLYLGTFDTAEEASQAFQSKKLEIQKLVKAKQQYNRQTHSCVRAKQDGKEKLVNVKQGQKTVDLEGFQLESAYGASLLDIEVPIVNTFNGGGEQRIESHEISHSRGLHMRNSGKCTSEILLGTLGTAEEASSAYQCKKSGFQISKKAELHMPTDSSAGKNQEGEQDEDLWMGQWVQLPGNKEINYSLKLGVPIIDSYGSLLGEFRSLDDLRIIKH